MKIIWKIVTTIFLTAIPAFLSYAANSTILFEKLIEQGILGESINVPVVQDWCLWVGILFSTVILSAKLLDTNMRCGRLTEQRNQLIRMNKSILASSLGKCFFSGVCTFDIRIFIPKHPMLYGIAERTHMTGIHKKFIIKNVDLIADQDITNNLQFEVDPNPVGLVGQCYQQKAILYDDNLEETNDKEYNLNRSQISRTSSLKWSICCPICNTNDDVVAIIALDGKNKVSLKEEKKDNLCKELWAFSRMLYDSVPQLFGRRG